MGRTLKKVLIGLLALAVLGGAAAWFLSKRVQQAGGLSGLADQLTSYLGRQVVGIANTYLVPELEYKTIRYDAPYTLTLGGLGLTAPDGTRVLELGTMVVTLAEAPKLDQPIRIKQLTLSDGALRVVRDPGTGGIRGLVPIVERGVRGPEAAEVEPNFRLSRVLVLERITLENLDLVYDAGDGSPPMEISGFSSELAVEPAAGAGPGWYALDFNAGRAPGLELEVRGRLNIDSFDAVIDRGTGRIALSEETVGSLPPELAGPLREYEARGGLSFTVSGSLPLTDAIAGAMLELNAELSAFHIALGNYTIPLDDAQMRATLSGGTLTVPSFVAKIVGGTLRADAALDLATADRAARANWTLEGLDIERFLREQPAEGPPDLAGILNGGGSASTRLADARAGLSGTGSVALRNGRLVRVPLVTELADAASVAGFGKGGKDTSLDAEFTLEPAGVRLSAFTLENTLLAARGSGLIGFDQSLDLSVNAGPLEKVQGMLGAVGDILGAVTDRLVTYKIEGSFEEPQVKVKPLGIGG